MADILHTLFVKAPVAEVFRCISSPAGLDRWWTKRCTGTPGPGVGYELYFSPQYQWRAVVSRCIANVEFELQMTHADPQWVGTKVGFKMREEGTATTRLEFHHSGWPQASNDFRVASFCWAMYLRCLKRYVEVKEESSYEDRVSA